jgi:Flp pilus assembly pilin Flp
MTAVCMAWAYCRGLVRRSVPTERGAALVEYAFLLVLIAVFCIGAVTLVGTSTDANLSETAGKLP